MYCYFFSEFPAAVKLNGAILGRVDGSPRGVNMDENVLVEICPLISGGNYNFIADKSFFDAPPPFVSITDLKGGYLIRLTERPLPAEFKIIAQQKTNYAAATVFYDGGLKLSLETPQGFFSDAYFFNDDNAEISFPAISSHDFAFIFFKGKSVLYVYDLVGKPKRVFATVANGFSLQPFTTTVLIKDMAKHKITAAYEFRNETFTEVSRKVEKSDSFDAEKVPLPLISYAFIEELSVGGDYSFYLSEGIKDNADKLREYLGEFIGIMPPPVFRDENEIGLVYKIEKNKYAVDYITVELKDNKIVNLKRSET